MRKIRYVTVVYVGILIAISMPIAVSSQSCPSGSFTGTTFSVVDITPTGAIFKVTISPTSSTLNGWSVALLFSSPLEDDITAKSYATNPVSGSDRSVITFTSKDYVKDLSSVQQFSFAFALESDGTNLLTDRMDFTAMVMFFEFPVNDASCVIEPNVVEPLPTTTTEATTPTTSASTKTTTTTTSTASSTTATSTTTTTVASTTPGVDAESTAVTYSLDNPGWNNGGVWTFIFKYDSLTGTYNDWTMKIVFSEEVTGITPWESVAEGPYSGGLVWFLKPADWNKNVAGILTGRAMADSTGNSAPSATITLYNNGVVPDTSTSNGGGGNVIGSTSSSASTTTSTAPVTVSSTTTIAPPDITGSLPSVARQTDIDFISSPDVDNENPFDYNEVLHMSLLFYEAQRSGELPENNRIPWRGDSGLRDGCVGTTCYADLVGGWYDAGDYIKFGFPMAWSTTVLAWGMLEFQEAYEDAEEWENALDCIKWTADYFVKAHVSPNELYFQVGDPHVDHSSWSHPETMTMDRPVYKIDANHPGTEVAAETAAALAAASIIFEDDSVYATNLLNHAIQLYSFADNYRGNYHETVPGSKVSEFYKSWSGYNDELMWGAMWLYKATNKEEYLNKAIQLANSVGTSEFSWDLKGPGALVLLSQERTMYKTSLFAAIDNVRNKETTPAGLTFFSQWGTNRYAANYALIALLAAKMEGLSSSTGQAYHDYAKEQLCNMLGSGDGDRSYVVGFGNNPPQRPHHRSSSCRLWNEEDPSTQVCNSQDRDAAGPNPLILYGALVGGPGKDGSYSDVRSDYVKNEVAVDYNAGFQSAVAGLRYFQL